MSQVNLNDDYLKLMGIYPTQGNPRNLAALGGIVSVRLSASSPGPKFAELDLNLIFSFFCSSFFSLPLSLRVLVFSTTGVLWRISRRCVDGR